MNYKKGISPVIATALLIVVSVVAVVGFQQWYSSYESILLSDTEQKSSSSIRNVNIEYISDDGFIYIKNGGVNLTIKNIKINENLCDINETLTFGLNPVDISTCLNSFETISDVVIITDKGIIEKKIFTGKIDDTSFEILSSSLLCKIDLDNDGYIDFNCAKYPMTNLTFEGSLDTNDNDSIIVPDSNCWLNTDKSSCVNNFIEGGCDDDANGINDTVLDIGTNLCWQRDMGTSGTSNWANSLNYCNNLNLANHGDWRLPTRQEFFTIRDLSRGAPTIVGGNNNIFINIIDPINDYYWTSSTYYFNAALVAWSIKIRDGTGSALVYSKTTNLYKICVRNN